MQGLVASHQSVTASKPSGIANHGECLMGAEIDGLRDLQADLAAAAEEFDDTAAAVVGTPVEYAPYVEFGTGPHVIEPDTAEALHWTEGGQDVFATRVMHPGTPAQPFFRPAIRQTRRNLPSVVGDPDSMEALVGRVAANIERLAKRHVPVDTGTLRASISWVMV